MNMYDVRRKNLRALARSVGGATKLAEKLNKAQSQVFHLIGSNPIKRIGDKFAAAVEQSFGKPTGWLDQAMITFYPVENPQPTATTPPFPIIPLANLPQWQELTREYFAQCTLEEKNKIFALQISAGEMAFLSNHYFPLGAVLMLAPLQSAEVGSLIIAQAKNANNILMGRYEIREQKKYLKPLNDHRPVIELTDEHIIYGVVRQLTANYE